MKAKVNKWTMGILLGILALALSAPMTAREAAARSPVSGAASKADATFSSNALLFIENVGQFDPRARFQVPAGDRTLWLTEDGLWVVLPERPKAPKAGVEGPRKGVVIQLSFPGANPHPVLEPFERRATSVNYFLGNDPARWRTNVPVWGGVRYRELYPGVDLEVKGEGGRLRLRLVTRAGADLSAVRLRVEGADSVELLPEGLRLITAVGAFTLPLLAVEGAQPGGPTAVIPLGAGGFEVIAPFARTASPAAPASVSLQSNPSDLLYATFLGGSGNDYGNGIAVDGNGAAYVVGTTYSSDFPTTSGAFDSTYNGNGDVFIVKLNPAGQGASDLLYATFLGGSGEDIGWSIAVDGSGVAYIVGETFSSDFPTTSGAFDPTHNGGWDGFLVKLNPGGQGASDLLYATFLGGNDEDYGYGIAVDGSGAAYVVGSTYSSDFPTTPGAFDPTRNGVRDVFIVKLNPAGQGASDLLYATFLGGSSTDYGLSIAVDGSGVAYVTGYTDSSDFPTTPEAFATTYGGGSWDGFLVKLNPAGQGPSDLLYATFLGGSGGDWGSGIAVDGSGATYVIGYTASSDFPTTTGAFDTTPNGGRDVFIVKLNLAGQGPSDLLYATFLGGSGDDLGYGIAVDGSGAVYVTGITLSSYFPTTTGAFDTTYNGGGDVFVVKLNPAGQETADLLYATFLGGSGGDWGSSIAVDGNGAVYVTGYTSSSNFPTTTGAFDPTYNGGSNDAFLVKLNPVGQGASDLLYATFLGGSGNDYGSGIAVDGSGAAYVVGGTDSSNFPTTPGAFDPTYGGGWADAFLVKLNPAGQGASDLLYATFLGGSGNDSGNGIAVDGSGAAYVAGDTSSSDFPTTTGAFDTTYNGGSSDAFLVKLNPAGQGPSDLLYATFLGGSSNDSGNGIAVDGSGAVYVTGSTSSSDFPTTSGAFDSTYNGGGSDAFLVKLNPAGQGPSDLLYSTFLGGSSSDDGNGIAVDGSGMAYIVGETFSNDFPTTPGAFDTSYDGWTDVFIVKLNPAGQGNADLLYATFLGGSESDDGNGIAVDGSGAVYVTGETDSSDFPTTPGAFDTTCGTDGTCDGGYTSDAFLVKLNPAGLGNADLLYATFLGGSEGDGGYDIAVDGSGAVYVTGHTQSPDFPRTPRAYDSTHNGWEDAFVVKLAIGGGQAAPDLVAAKSNNVGGAIPPGNPFTWTVTISNIGSANATFAADQVILRDDLPSGATYGTPSVQNLINVTGTIACSIASNTLTCTASGGPVTVGVGGRFEVVFSVTPTAPGTLTNPTSGGLCRADPNGAVAEGNENNNDCADSVVVRYRLYLPLVLRNY